MTLPQFIAPRQVLLIDGNVTEFHEWESKQQTFIQSNLATRICYYQKQGVLNGKPFKGGGDKHMAR